MLQGVPVRLLRKDVGQEAKKESEGEVKRLSITEARKICESLGARGVIVIAFSEDDMAGTNYGATRAECADLGQTLDAIIESMQTGNLIVWRKNHGV